MFVGWAWGAVGQPAFDRQIAPSALAALHPLDRAPDFPVTLVWGEADHFIPPRRGDELVDKLGAPGPARIPEAGRLAPEDAPERVVATLLRVLG
ncbi:MAG: alpha/beta fold hydrolase [Alphaproteobacteria bacterium]